MFVGFVRLSDLNRCFFFDLKNKMFLLEVRVLFFTVKITYIKGIVYTVSCYKSTHKALPTGLQNNSQSISVLQH